MFPGRAELCCVVVTISALLLIVLDFLCGHLGSRTVNLVPPKDVPFLLSPSVFTPLLSPFLRSSNILLGGKFSFRHYAINDQKKEHILEVSSSDLLPHGSTEIEH